MFRVEQQLISWEREWNWAAGPGNNTGPASLLKGSDGPIGSQEGFTQSICHSFLVNWTLLRQRLSTPSSLKIISFQLGCLCDLAQLPDLVATSLLCCHSCWGSMCWCCSLSACVCTTEQCWILTLHGFQALPPAHVCRQCRGLQMKFPNVSKLHETVKH